MSASQRFFGYVSTDIGRASLFAGVDDDQRMKEVRTKIEEVRAAWHDPVKLHAIMDGIRALIRRREVVEDEILQRQVENMLNGFTDWADIDYKRNEAIDYDRYTGLEIYCSEKGYNLIFRLLNGILRMKSVDEDALLAVAGMVELLTIEMYNLRLSNVGDERYSNFQGVTYRGMPITSEALEEFRKAAEVEDLSQRKFSIPLGFISTSTDKKTMYEFAGSDPSAPHRMCWTIHVHGLDPELLDHYRKRYDRSVVTSICAMPVGRISAYGEKEILLRGPFFHIVGLKSEEEDGIIIHNLEVVMLNVNRDHGSERATTTAEKEDQRSFFRNIVLASRYQICAPLARKYSTKDADEYERLANEAFSRLNIATSGNLNAKYDPSLSERESHGTAAWLGASVSRAFPSNYASLRMRWHEAAERNDWVTIMEILSKEYSWQKRDWFHVTPLRISWEGDDVTDGAPRKGFTLLHEMALHGTKPANDEWQKMAWDNLLAEIEACSAWKTIRTFDSDAKTAQEIAEQSGNKELEALFSPKLHHNLPPRVLSNLENKLHTMIRDHADKYLSIYSFRMPQLSVLTEMEDPKIWIPIPGMVGGFHVRLQGSELGVTIFETISGAVRQKETFLHITADTTTNDFQVL